MGRNRKTERGTKWKCLGSDSDSDSEEEVGNPVDSLLTSLKPRLEARSKGQLSERAALFYDRPEFEAIGTDDDEDAVENGVTPGTHELVQINKNETEEDTASENGFEEVPVNTEPDRWDDDSDTDKISPKQGIYLILISI